MSLIHSLSYTDGLFTGVTSELFRRNQSHLRQLNICHMISLFQKALLKGPHQEGLALWHGNTGLVVHIWWIVNSSFDVWMYMCGEGRKITMFAHKSCHLFKNIVNANKYVDELGSIDLWHGSKLTMAMWAPNTLSSSHYTFKMRKLLFQRAKRTSEKNVFPYLFYYSLYFSVCLKHHNKEKEKKQDFTCFSKCRMSLSYFQECVGT